MEIQADERLLYNKCPLCSCETLTHYTVGDCSKHALYHPSLSAKIKWKKCSRCAHVFTEGYLTDAACHLIISKTHEHQEVGYDIERQRIISSRIVEKIIPFACHGVWLDVGFGNGSLLFTAQEYGFESIGVDLRQDNVRAMCSLGVHSYCEDFTRLSLDTKCTVISMADVLEHMPYPIDGLMAAYRLLSDDGILFISMPNMDSIVWKALDRNNANPYWGEIEHFHNFTRTRMYELLKENNFEPVRYGISERYRACMEIISRKI